MGIALSFYLCTLAWEAEGEAEGGAGPQREEEEQDGGSSGGKHG